ncbi:MAG TPA: invasion associated locus B family protein [Devosia sp.]|nr:invasion associated locus B family protein [Devosia sp.]
MKVLPVLALLFLPLLPANAAFAQASGAACAAIDDDPERLACYDGVFRAAPVEPANSVTFNSEQLIPAKPSGRQPAVITVACDAGVLSVKFAFAGNTMSPIGGDTGITLQLDLQAARSMTLPIADNNTALVIDRNAEAFLDSLRGANNLTVRVTPVSSRSLSVRFKLDGVVEAIAPVQAACE